MATSAVALGETTLLLNTDPQGNVGLLPLIKGAVLAIVEDGEIMVLLRHEGTFEWREISECIPRNSKRKYSDKPVAVVSPSVPEWQGNTP